MCAYVQCGLECTSDIAFTDSAHCVSVVLVGCRIYCDQSYFFMQDGVGERDVKFTEVEKTLSKMGQLKTLLLGIDCVSLSYVVSF